MRPLTRLAADPLSHLLKGRHSRPGCERGHRTQALPRPVIPWYRHRGKGKGWDFVTGFGFYLSAIYAVHYNMLKHVTKQLSEAIASDGLKISIDWTRQGIFGRGHNALAPYLTSLLGFGDSTRPKQYRSVSGFAPGSNLSVSPWGIKAVAPRWSGFMAVGMVGCCRRTSWRRQGRWDTTQSEEATRQRERSLLCTPHSPRTRLVCSPIRFGNPFQ